MQILVTGAGRSGTNLSAAIVRALEFEFYAQSEDRTFFDKKTLPRNYGTKLACENRGYTIDNLERMLKINKDLRVVFCVRHPIDTCLSKIARAQPVGSYPFTDSTDKTIAPDATLKGSMKNVLFAREVYLFLKKYHNDRTLLVKMENVISRYNEETQRIASFLGKGAQVSLEDIFKNNQKKKHLERYGQELKKDQIDLYKKYGEIFEGFFSEKDYLKEMRNTLKPFAITFEYSLE